MPTVIFKRQELYEQVWAEPVRTVAKRYGVSDVAFAKMCRKLHIPLPPRGYWARIAAGQKPKRAPLRKAPAGVEDEVRWWQAPRPERPAPPDVPPEVQARIAREKEPDVAVVVPQTLEAPHKLVAAAGKILRRLKPDDYGRVRSYRETCLHIAVSPPSLDRALRIVDAFIKAAIQRGYAVEVTPYVERSYYAREENVSRVIVDGVPIAFELFEKSTGNREPMPKPPKGLTGPELRSWEWMNKPRIVHTANGIFELTLSARFSKAVFTDRGKSRLEDRLNDVLAKLPAIAHAVREAEANEAHEREKREEEARRRHEEQRRAEADRQRAEKFKTELDAWRLAKDIREYVAEVHAVVTEGKCVIAKGGELDEKLVWALRYADRIDPLSLLRGQIAELQAERDGESAQNDGRDSTGATPCDQADP